MEPKEAAVFGLYADTAKAEEALDYLTGEQFSSDDVSVVMRDALGFKVSSGTLGLLADAGPVTVSGGSTVIVAGPIRSLLRKGSGSISTYPTLMDLLETVGVSRWKTQKLAQRIDDKGVLLSVQCGSRSEIQRALAVLSGTGAEEIVLPDLYLPNQGDEEQGNRPIQPLSEAAVERRPEAEHGTVDCRQV